jgi:hypothetical protein
MDTFHRNAQDEHQLPAPPHTVRVSLFAKKLVGLLVGGIVGILVGWLIQRYCYPWATGNYHLIAGGLSGAVIGALAPGRTLGRLGWPIVLSTGGGAIVGWLMSAPKERLDLQGAVYGFVLGLTLGLIFECALLLRKKSQSGR